MSYTRAPWHIDETEDSIFILSDVSDICGLIDKGTVGIEDAMANARLIASAPDAVTLFEDLQEYLCEHGGEAVELLERIDLWLTKATGGAE